MDKEQGQMIEVQPAYYPLYENKDKFIILITGGRGSAKSFNASTFIERLTFEQGHKILFSRYTMRSASVSVIPEFNEKIELEGTQEYFDVTQSDVTNKVSDSVVMFRGIKTSSGNQTANLKSIQGLSTFVCDEAEEWVSEQDFDKLVLSIRQKGIQNRIIIIMNPCDVNHFVYQKYIKNTHKLVDIDGVQVQISTHPNVLHIHTTYLDNIEHLSRQFIDEVSEIKANNPKKYAHIIIGKWADITEGAVFKNWELVDEIPPYVKKRGIGMDFGYTNDPTAIIECAVHENDLYLNELCYRTHMLSKDIIEFLKPLKSKIISESADPRLIQEISNAGILIYPVQKSQGSIKAGLDKMQEYTIKVTKHSYNLLEELRSYTWDKDKDGKFINQPIDKFNHCFSGETQIITNKGNIRIDNIKVGDYVLTSNGFRKVTAFFENGSKKILHIKLKFSNLIVDIKATPDHKFKTINGWKQLQGLRKGDVLYLHKYLTEKNTGYIKESDIFQEVKKGYIEKSGNFTMEKCRMDTMCITRMAIHGIMTYLISNLLNVLNTCLCMFKNRYSKKESKNFKKEWNMPDVLLMSGINQKRAGDGIVNKLKNPLCLKRSKNSIANFVKLILNQQTMEAINFAPINANQHTGCTLESIMKLEFVSNVEQSSQPINITRKNSVVEDAAEEILQIAELKEVETVREDICDVYDLEVEDMHEFFANGVLVHNCIDASRYWIYGEMFGRIIMNKMPSKEDTWIF